MAIEFSKEKQDYLIASIKRYFEDVMEMELPGNSEAAAMKPQRIGDLKARFLLDFFLEEIGPAIYNQAVSDAQTRMSEMIDELDGTCHEAEGNYWVKHAKKRG